MSIILLFIIFFTSESFKIIAPNRKATYITPRMLSTDKPPKLWNTLSSVLKINARQWFISRAEKLGIDWSNLKEQNVKKMDRLIELKNNFTDYTMTYPEYYKQPFHGYDSGNLNWLAAVEGEPATLSIALNYWKEMNVAPVVSQDWLRYNITSNIKNFLQRNTSSINYPKEILDIGCSVGISSEFLYKSFIHSNITGIDLSPFFVSMAKLRAEELKIPIRYYHQNAENTQFQSNTFDLVTCNFLMHELPEDATKNILDEIHDKIKSGGVIAITDLTPATLKNDLFVSQFRRWAFEVTEPHIYGYYKRDMTLLLQEAGFVDVTQCQNDPLNSVWLASKP